MLWGVALYKRIAVVVTGVGKVKLQSPVLPDTLPAVTQVLPDRYWIVAAATFRPEEPQVLPVSTTRRPTVCAVLQVYWNHGVGSPDPEYTQQ